MKRRTDIPASWVEVPLSEVAHHDLGKMLDRAKQTSGTAYPYLRNINVRWGEFDLDDIFEINLRQEEIERYSLKAGDLIICEGGEPGRCAVWNGNISDMKYQKALHRVRLLGGIDPRVVALKLRADAESGQLSRLFTGTTIKHLTGKALARYRVLLPPLNEQERIVERFEALQQRTRRARTALDAIPPLLEKFRQSVLAAAFRGDLTADWRARNPDVEPASALLDRIRVERRRRWEEAELAKMRAKGKVPKDEHWREKYDKKVRRASRGDLAKINAMKRAMADVPENWEIVQLGEVAELQPGYAFKSQWFSKSGIRLLRGTNVVPGGTRWTDTVHLTPDKAREFSEYLLGNGDLVIAMDRPIISSGIKVARLTEADVPALLLQRVGRFRIEDQEVHADYIMHFLSSRFFIAHVSGQETGTQLPHISQTDIETVLVPIPPSDEQQEIISRVEALLDRIDAVLKEVPSACDNLNRLESSILAKAFRGALVPQDPNDEPASKLLERIRAERTAREPVRRGRRVAKRAPTPEPAQLPLALAPEPGEKPDARAYTLDDWRRVLLESLGDEPAERQDAIEAAAIWAAENMGLVYERLPKNGVIVRGLKSALRSAIRRGEVERLGPSRVRRLARP